MQDLVFANDSHLRQNGRMSAVTDQPPILTAADRAAPALADAPTGQRLRVLRLQAPAGGGADGWQQQLADLGFTPGETAMVMRRGWPSGDPLAVRIGSSTFALRRAEAACVRVEPLT